ncbi:MAG: glutamine--fructose-6-phosphate transaminase (isomerizing) [Anaerolineae bacterium]
MCGIVGYVGPRPATSILLEGLKRLEYRGYDSAGIAVLSPERQIQLAKSEGRLAKLLKSLDGRAPTGHLGLGHTRWATHGEPNDVNAHPHADCSGRLVVVHNGIIENFRELRQGLLDRGHRFVSQTDTEVIVHLIEESFSRSEHGDAGDAPDLQEAVRRALSRVDGAYALAVFSAEHPELLVAARRFSPLIVGLGEGENFLASDIPAFLSQTRQYLVIEDGEVVGVDREGAEIRTLAGEAVVREPFAVDWSVEAAERSGYPHFYLKEIHEQPQTIVDALRGRVEGDTVSLPELEPLDMDGVQRIHIVACGSSYYAGLVGKHLIEGSARIPVEVAIASEYRYRDPVVDAHTLLLPISQSGETADTLAALRLAREKGAKALAMANALGSTITRESDATVYLQAGPEVAVVATKTFTAELVTLALFAVWLGRMRKTLSEQEAAGVLSELRQMPGKVERVLTDNERIGALARKYADRQSFFFLGRGVNYPIALEGALKLKEISYLHAEGYPAGELKHGPIAMLDPDLPVVALATQSTQYGKMVSSMQEVRARKAEVIALTEKGDREIGAHADQLMRVPGASERLSPIVNVVPLQLFAYHIADERGCDIDKPRNLAKSVTVE